MRLGVPLICVVPSAWVIVLTASATGVADAAEDAVGAALGEAEEADGVEADPQAAVIVSSPRESRKVSGLVNRFKAYSPYVKIMIIV